MRGWICVAAVGCAVLLADGVSAPASAQYLASLFDSYSPFVNVPPLQGEVRVRPIVTRIVKGTHTIGARTWDLRDDFGLSRSEVFVDIMGRLQVSRFSFRIHFDTRDFHGSKASKAIPGSPVGDARLDYTGIRLGGDVDTVQWGRSRIGVNLDYDLFTPVFTEAVQTASGKRMSDDSLLTIGVHAVLSPPYNLYGVSAIVEGRARWSVSGTEITDWELAGGFVGPQTVLGSVALRGGYRCTVLEFRDTQIFAGVPAASIFDVTFDGWFGELVYYY